MRSLTITVRQRSPRCPIPYTALICTSNRRPADLGTLFSLPCFFVILGLSFLYVTAGTAPMAQGLFVGHKAAVIVTVNLALWFSVHALFGKVSPQRWLGASIEIPVLTTLQNRY